MSGPNRPWAQELERRATRQLLHASDLTFVHPSTGEEMRFDADLPRDMAEVVSWARGDEEGGDGRG
jgi:hypothetical protein